MQRNQQPRGKPSLQQEGRPSDKGESVGEGLSSPCHSHHQDTSSVWAVQGSLVYGDVDTKPTVIGSGGQGILQHEE